MPPISPFRPFRPFSNLNPTRLQEPVIASKAKTVAPVAAAKVECFSAVSKKSAAGPVNPVTNPKDWHLPKLDEVFELARQYPGKDIFLDIKLPADNPEVAQRMASQLMEMLRKFPDMKDRVVIGLPNKQNLDTLKAAFASQPDFASFKNFTFDHEELNVLGTGAAPADAHPLHGSGDNQHVSIGDPKAPGCKGNWDDLLAMAKDTIAQASDPNSPHFGKKLTVWTVNDADKIKQLAELGVHAIMTDEPDLANSILDKLYAKDDPRRPKVMCHRGGPDDGFAPENTMPMIERGLRKGDAIEIDLVSCKDGIALYHDNDASDLVGTIRNQGFEGSEFRPTNPSVFSSLRGIPAHELTVEQLRKGYGYEKTWPDAPFQSSKSPVVRVIGKVLGAVNTVALGAVRLAGVVAVAVAAGVKTVVDAVKSALDSVASFFGFGRKKKKAPKAQPPRPAPPVGVTATVRRPPPPQVGVTATVRRPPAPQAGVAATVRRPPEPTKPAAIGTGRSPGLGGMTRAIGGRAAVEPHKVAVPLKGTYGSSGFD